MFKPVVLVILDGWGISKSKKGNAISEASTPNIEKLTKFYPHIAIQASGISVGLPWGESGNSEVGHIVIGTGRIIYQSMPRITMAIQNGEFFKNPALLKSIDHARENNSSLHLMGLIGRGSVHSYLDHLYALLEMAKQQKQAQVFLHLFTDGRDSEVTEGVKCVEEIQEKLKEIGVGKIASLSGRYYSMDRSHNWDRTEKAYRMLTEGKGEKITDPAKYLKDSYAKKIFDEYIEPACMMEGDTFPGEIKDNDAVIFFNYREDRARQLTKAFTLPGFSKFERIRFEKLSFTTMIKYEEGLPTEVAFPPIEIKDTLGELISKKSLSQLRISETEKFAHVTYFFNGGNEEPYAKEDRVIIPSNSHVSSFDEAPEMKASEITERVLAAIDMNKYTFILINYANADIVGHTGNEKASIQAVEIIDECLGKLIPAVIQKEGCLIITADHGNAEEITDSRGEINTEHSSNPVPLWFITSENHSEKERSEEFEVQGLLSDIAPTILEIMEIKKPDVMTGESLLPFLK